jgi:NADH:ubiquinone oxidoreductase subunit C
VTTVSPRTGDRRPVPGSGRRMSPEELAAYLRERLEHRVLDVEISFGQLTVDVTPEALVMAARLCKTDPNLDFDFWDFMAGVDERDEGLAVVTHLYSVRHGHHISLRVLAPGGRGTPTLPTLTDVYRGANWSERETYDMYGIVFTGHPGLEPRILTVENFEGWPLRKEFLLSTREVKPWPGLKEPKDPGEAEEGDGAAGAAAASGPSAEEKAAAAKEKAERAKRKAAEMRAKKAAERARARQEEDVAGGPPDAVPPEGSDAREFAERAGADAEVDEAARESGGERPGAGAQRAGAPGVEEEGRHTGAVEQSGDRPAADTPGMTSPTQDAEPARTVGETPAPGPESDEPPADRPADDTSASRGVEERAARRRADEEPGDDGSEADGPTRS